MLEIGLPLEGDIMTTRLLGRVKHVLSLPGLKSELSIVEMDGRIGRATRVARGALRHPDPVTLIRIILVLFEFLFD